MRIGIDYTSAINQRAGIGRFTRGLVKALAEMDSPHSFKLYHAKSRLDLDDSNWPDNFSFKLLPFTEWTLNVLWHRLRLPLHVEGFAGSFDIFHAPDFTLPPLRSDKGIVTVHDLSFMLFPEQADPGLVRYLNKVVPRSIERARAVLADSFSTKNDLIRLLSVAPEKIRVIHGGVDSHFEPIENPDLREQVLARHGIKGKFILTVGTLQPRKNLIRLIEAYASLKRSGGIEHSLVVVGAKGWLYDSFFRLLQDEGLTENVVVPGFIPDADLPVLMSSAEVFVFPSLYEGFGLPPLEAMACGTAVVCSSSSSLPEVVGEAGLLVDPTSTGDIARAILLLVNNPDLRREFGQKGLQQAAKFNWRDTAEKTLAVYEAVATGRPLEKV